MDIKQTLRTLMIAPPKKSILLEAGHGVGKSEIVAQAAAEKSRRLNKPFGFIDIRLGQYEVGDLTGLPSKRDSYTVTNKVFSGGVITDEKVVITNATVHDLPLWFPRDPDSCGYLFLDELNRGNRDTQQWAMQVVLDYRANFHDLPVGWRVVAAVNDDQDIYKVTDMDPALRSRFLVVKFQPSIPEWLEYAENNGVHDAVVKYIRKFGNDLDSPENMSDTKLIYPCRRSWVLLSTFIKNAAEEGDDLLKDPDYLYHIAKGYLGNAIADNFTQWVKKDYQVFSAEEILNNFPKYEKEFEKMIITDLTFYNKEIIKYVKDSKEKLDKKQSVNLFRYFKVVPKEAASGFWADFSKECREKATEWYKSDAGIGEYVMKELFSKENSKTKTK